MFFEWDPEKAVSNERKHGVSFQEALEVFGDRLSVTVHDPRHSRDEERLVLFGSSFRGRLLAVMHTERHGRVRIHQRARSDGSRAKRIRRRRTVMSDETLSADEMLPEYSLKGGVRGKYAAAFDEGTNMVLLDPDVAEVFPDAESVNRALRALAEIIRERAGHAA